MAGIKATEEGGNQRDGESGAGIRDGTQPAVERGETAGFVDFLVKTADKLGWALPVFHSAEFIYLQKPFKCSGDTQSLCCGNAGTRRSRLVVVLS